MGAISSVWRPRSIFDAVFEKYPGDRRRRFIGQNFVHHLAAQADPPRITVLDALTYAANPYSLEPLIVAGKVEFVKGDITDLLVLEMVFAAGKFDAVAHFAAESHVDRSILGPDAFIQTNIVGTYNLLKCALADWTGREILDDARFLHVSTDEVFGDLTAVEAPFTENSPYRPSSPYSASKAGADHLVRAFIRTYRLPGFITNCSNNYGPYQHPEKMIPLMIIHALQGKPMPVYGDGLNVRDWLLSKTIATPCWKCCGAEKLGRPTMSAVAPNAQTGTS